MKAKIRKWSLAYLIIYLGGGGAGLTFIPDFVLQLFGSTGDYSDAMPRLVGIFMMALAYLIFNIFNNKDWHYYPVSIVVRTFIVLLLFWLYAKSGDLLFIVFNAIVLIGLLPSIFAYFFMKEEIQEEEV